MEFAPRMLMQAKSIRMVPWFHYDYLRRESGSITSSPANRARRIESLFKIIDLLRDARPLADGKRNRKALDIARFWLYRKLFNFVSYEEFTAPGNGFSARRAEMRALVRSHLTYRATSMQFVRRILFLISPNWLKKKESIL
jgi:hypothetical protein